MEVKSQQTAEGSSLGWGVGMGCGVREPEQFFYFCAVGPSGRPLNYGHIADNRVTPSAIRPNGHPYGHPHSIKLKEHYCTAIQLALRTSLLSYRQQNGQLHGHTANNTASITAVRPALRPYDHTTIRPYGHTASTANEITASIKASITAIRPALLPYNHHYGDTASIAAVEPYGQHYGHTAIRPAMRP